MVKFGDFETLAILKLTKYLYSTFDGFARCYFREIDHLAKIVKTLMPQVRAASSELS